MSRLFSHSQLSRARHLAYDLVKPSRDQRHALVYVPGLYSHRVGEKSNQLAEFACGHQCAFARYDLYGHGDSQGELYDICLSESVTDLQAFLGHLHEDEGIDTFNVVGYSFGALVAAWGCTSLPSTTPFKITALQLVAPGFGLRDRLASLPPGEDSDMIQIPSRYCDKMLLRKSRFFGPRELRFLSDSELVNGLRHADVAIQVFHGDKDEVIPLELVQQVVANLNITETKRGSVHLHILEDGDHRLNQQFGHVLAEMHRVWNVDLR